MKNCAPRAVGLAGHDHGGHRAPRHLRRARLLFHRVQSAACRIGSRFGRILRQRIAALHHAARDHPVKDRPLVAARHRAIFMKCAV